jgi:metallophosphoesterase (TIGR00282 family)
VIRILFVGDVMGEAGRRILHAHLESLVDHERVDLVVANVENAAGGFGMSEKIHNELTGLGVDVLTTGNHVWDRREFAAEIDNCERVIRPANYAPLVPGKGWIVIETDHGPAAVINLAGRVFMPPADCPFRTADQVLAELDPDVQVIIVDFHAEATSEKQALGYYLDGRVTALVGTHTHVATADERLLPRGSAYISDVGMTGPRDSVIGVKQETVIEKFITGMPRRFDTAPGAIELNAVRVSCDPKTGRADSITRVHHELEPD